MFSAIRNEYDSQKKVYSLCTFVSDIAIGTLLSPILGIIFAIIFLISAIMHSFNLRIAKKTNHTAIARDIKIDLKEAKRNLFWSVFRIFTITYPLRVFVVLYQKGLLSSSSSWQERTAAIPFV